MQTQGESRRGDVDVNRHIERRCEGETVVGYIIALSAILFATQLVHSVMYSKIHKPPWHIQSL